MKNTLKELQKKYARQSKNRKAWGWFQNNNAGNSIIGNKFFNTAMGSDGCAQAAPDGGIGMVGDTGGSVGENLDKEHTLYCKKEIGENTGESAMENQEVVFCYSPEETGEEIFPEDTEVELVVSKDDIIRALCQLLRDDCNFVYMDDEEFNSTIQEHWEAIKDSYYDKLHEYFSHNIANSSTSLITEDLDCDDDVCECNYGEVEDSDPYLTTTTFEDIDSDDPEIPVTKYDKLSSAFLDEDLQEESRYELVDRKTVTDFDGFTTDYSWYRDTLEDKYVMVFGDSDVYIPEDGEFDAEFDNYNVAKEWFDTYNGFEDEDVDECLHKEIDYIESNYALRPVSPYDDYDSQVLGENVKRDLITLRQIAENNDFDTDVHSDGRVEITYYDAKGNSFTRRYADATEALDDLYDRGYLTQDDDYEEIDYDDVPLDEAVIKDLYTDLQDPQYINKLKNNIQALKRELHFLRYQAPREIRKGGAFDSQEEIDEAITTTERELNREEAKLAIIQRRED